MCSVPRFGFQIFEILYAWIQIWFRISSRSKIGSIPFYMEPETPDTWIMDPQFQPKLTFFISSLSPADLLYMKTRMDTQTMRPSNQNKYIPVVSLSHAPNIASATTIAIAKRADWQNEEMEGHGPHQILSKPSLFICRHERLVGLKVGPKPNYLREYLVQAI